MTESPRDAATVMLVRDAAGAGARTGVEVCMLRRNLASEFVAGAYVFPGGSVDPADRGPAADELCQGLDDAEASALLGVGSGRPGLLGGRPAGVLRGGRGPAGPAPGRGRRHRAARHHATRPSGPASRRTGSRSTRAGPGLLDVCRAEGLVLAADTVHYVSHWITPELAPRRYDTRFFVTAAPPGQVAHHDDGETIATIWVRPTDALVPVRGRRDRAAAADHRLPRRSSAVHATTEEVMAWARQVTDMPTILPIVLIEDGRLLILRPGDDGYDAGARGPAWPPRTRRRRSWPPPPGTPGDPKAGRN